MPPDFGKIGIVWRPALETIALPAAILTPVNLTPSNHRKSARISGGFRRAERP
jgi:hypothetical protein